MIFAISYPFSGPIVYDLQVINSAHNTERIHLKAASGQEIATIVPPPVKKNEFKLTDDQQTGILTYSNTNYPNDSIRNSFLNTVFDELKNKEVGNLIIDFRGNGGGTPTNAAYLLKYLMKNDFIYSNNTSYPEYADLTKPINLSNNRFVGKVSFLIDGTCFSSTGHMLSMVKYYNLGPLIGELCSATYSCNTNGVPYLLSNTGLILNCPPSIYETAVNGFDRALGIPPDFEVKNTLLDIIDGKDKVMEFALKHSISSDTITRSR